MYPFPCVVYNPINFTFSQLMHEWKYTRDADASQRKQRKQEKKKVEGEKVNERRMKGDK